jgi:glycosyltransferase involved in cell wall biosynthesis
MTLRALGLGPHHDGSPPRAEIGTPYAWVGPWYRHHNNPRYFQLIPRLRTVTARRVPISGVRFVRRLQLRFAYPYVARAAVKKLNGRSVGLFCTDLRQLPLFSGPIVVDFDDPLFTRDEVGALSQSNIRLVVVTTAQAQDRLTTMGLRCATEVIPQGVSLCSLQAGDAAAVRRLRRPASVVLGYAQPFLFLQSDFGRLDADRAIYCIDDLLTAFRMARDRRPELELWLLGYPSRNVRRRCAAEPGVRMIGFIPPHRLLRVVANFDIGVYPRFTDLGGRESVKMIETLACGVPVVSADVSEAAPVRASGGGLVARTPAEMAEGIAFLAESPRERTRLGELGRQFGRLRDWDVIAARYDRTLRAAT